MVQKHIELVLQILLERKFLREQHKLGLLGHKLEHLVRRFSLGHKLAHLARRFSLGHKLEHLARRLGLLGQRFLLVLGRMERERRFLLVQQL